jgi:hypothetical protein
MRKKVITVSDSQLLETLRHEARQLSDAANAIDTKAADAFNDEIFGRCAHAGSYSTQRILTEGAVENMRQWLSTRS